MKINIMKVVHIIPVIAAMFFVLLVSSCTGSKDSGTGGKVENIEWKLESLNGMAVALKSGKSITLKFDGNTAKISGKAVCNSYFGGYTITDETIVISGIGSTKMMCDDNLNETDYFSALTSANSYKVSGGNLSLMNNGKVTTVFKK
jgi:heat shock protein HslJ